MKTEKNKTYRLKLTAQQQEEVRELLGRTGETLELTVEELEERILPGYSSTQ
jgi:hypothetical protein